MNHIDENGLVMHYYGDDDRRAVAAHLAECERCRERFSALTDDLAALTAAEVPERGEDYGAQVWARIAPRLERRPAAWRERWRLPGLTWPRLAMAGSLAVIVVAAFVAGRYSRTPITPAPVVAQAPPPVVRERILLVAVGEHLERSRVVLTEIANRDGGGTIDLGVERARAGDLVATNRLYRQAALGSGDPGMATTLEELERVLVEIANGPDTMSADGLTQLRTRIESQGLLFKVTVLGSQVRQRQRDAMAPAASRSGSST